MTENLYDRIAECDAEMKRIERDVIALERAVEVLVSDFAVKYPNVGADGLTIDFACRLTDILDDLQGPAWRRKSRIEDVISARDEADLHRSRPVTL